jgi:hypothetical protein
MHALCFFLLSTKEDDLGPVLFRVSFDIKRETWRVEGYEAVGGE